jgi:hypothetical protein
VLLLQSVSADGTSYVSENKGESFGMSPQAALAVGADGKDLKGWVAFSSKEGFHLRDIVVGDGLVRVSYPMDPTNATSQDTYTWLDLAGRPLGTKVAGPKAMTEYDVAVTADGYLVVADYSMGAEGMSGPGKLLEYGPDGKPRTGWPVELKGWPESPVVAPDGTVWTMEHSSVTSAQVVGFSPDGTRVAGTPVAVTCDNYTAMAIGPAGTFFTTDHVSGSTTVIAVKQGG